MSAVGGRLSLSNEFYYGDQERDANSLLAELDKGLRSSKAGEQCESIVRFPRLFEKYPFPILINSAFLKLADLFRIGSNFLRLCILKVTQQSEKHLDKILNVDEFLRRIYAVIHSNDPVARAITLRTLGSAARLIPERKNVHHSIINSLDSRDAVELEAAIFAADKFAAQSKTFASSICSKLSDMIEGLATPVEMKLKLIPIFQHMHHDTRAATRVRQQCTSLLDNYPARGVVLVTLHTLSQLSARSLIDIPQQVELLLQYLQCDVRGCVKSSALKDLHLLARRGPHMWTEQKVVALCQFTVETPYEGLQLGALEVLSTLSDTIAAAKFPTNNADSVVLSCCRQRCYHGNVRIASQACQMFANLAMYKEKDQVGSLNEEASQALESLVLVTTSQQSKVNLQALKKCLHSVTRLCRTCPLVTDKFVDTITTTLSSVPGDYALMLCECLSAISSQQNDLLSSLVKDILAALEQSLNSPDKYSPKLTVALLRLLFQASLDDGLPPATMSLLSQVLSHTDCWRAYQIGRQAARYGHHSQAAAIFGGLKTQVSSEHFFFWFSALENCCHGESCLLHTPDGSDVSAFMKRVAEAENYYQKAISSLKAATTPNHPLQFQCQYLQLRIQTMQLLMQLVRACCSFQTSPPPAIATSLAMTTGQEIHRCGHVVAQLQKCKQQIGDLAKNYKLLFQSSFDADPVTLTGLQILQQLGQVLVYVLDTILLKTQTSEGKRDVAPPMSLATQRVCIEHQPCVSACQDVLQQLQKISQTSSTGSLTYEHVECLQQSAMLLCQVPLCLPRYFFQKLQSTDIKLALSPQPRNLPDPISISHDSHLTLKVEGVIQHGTRAGLFRKVHSVKVTVQSEQQSKDKVTMEVKSPESCVNDLNQTVAPHNDYFSTQFLLQFNVAGLHLVNVDAAVVDGQGSVWITGPRATVSVKSYDEAAQRLQQEKHAARRQQQRAAAAAAAASNHF